MGLQVYGFGGYTKVGPPPISAKNAPPASYRGLLGQLWFDTSTSPPTEYTFNGQSWESTVGGDVVIDGNLEVTGTIIGDSSITATTTLAAGTTVTGGTGVTATTGPLTATNGNLVLGTAGNKLSIATGANASVGTSSAMIAGTTTVNTTAVTASSIILLSPKTPGGTQGSLSVGTITAGTSFVINSSSNTDTSTVHWLIIN